MKLKNLPENALSIGIHGYNDKKRASYDPMKSKGPGKKEYNLTLFALSEKLHFDKSKVYRSDLMKAIKGKILGQTTLKYTYETNFFQI